MNSRKLLASNALSVASFKNKGKELFLTKISFIIKSAKFKLKKNKSINKIL